MKINIGDYEVTISAKHPYTGGAATMPLLCDLSIALFYASQYAESKGLHATSKYYKGLRRTVYDALDKRGYYNDVKK